MSRHLLALYIIGTLILFGCKREVQTTPTPIPPPQSGVASISTDFIVTVAIDSAITGGKITLNGDVPVIESGICYSTSPNPTISSLKQVKTVANGSFNVTLKSLTPITKHYFKAYMINSKGVFYGEQQSFTTNAYPLSDTISYIKKLEEYFFEGNPGLGPAILRKDYSFFYDIQKRLTIVGIRSYSGNNNYDSFTCILNYQGVNAKPASIITPNLVTANPVQYDTTFFTYNANQLVSDSCNEFQEVGSPVRMPLKRLYSYPTSNTSIVKWYRKTIAVPLLELSKVDTVYRDPQKIVLGFYNSTSQTISNVAAAAFFINSSYVNPLSKLNISGTITSLIYKPVRVEILGNSLYKPVYNTNAVANYLDFFSPTIPTSFFIGSYSWIVNNGSGSGSADNFFISITPWVQRINYPATIEVRASTSLPGNKHIYKYYYY